jgi:dipeptidyl aminopeptidase/acylaminoacyl peptidase
MQDTTGAPGVARFLSVDTVEAPTFAVDGSLLFLADTTGTPQVWCLDRPAAWPERLTPAGERVSTVAASPTRREFVFAADRGGDERDGLFRYDRTSGAIRPLTDDPAAIHQWGGWSPDGDRVAYTANRRDSAAFDVHVQDRTAAPGADRRVFEGSEGWLTVAAWGPDGRRLVLTEPRGSLDVGLSLLDVETGDHRRLDDDQPAVYRDVHFGPEGDHLYLVTDYGADSSYLGSVDLATGKTRRVAGGPTDDEPGAGTSDVETGERVRPDRAEGVEPVDGWPVDSLAVDRRTGRLVYTRNVDGEATLHAGYLDRYEFVANAAPDPGGVLTQPTFGPAGNRYAFVRTAPGDPYGVHVTEFGTDLHTAWTPVGTGGLPAERFPTPEVVRYDSFDGRQIPAYWTLPPELELAPDAPDAVADGGSGTDSTADDGGQVPVIVDVHGGPTHQRRPWFYPQKAFYLSRGYAVLEPNVRGSTGYGRAYSELDDVENRLDSVRDLQAAVEWLADQPAVDADRVVAYGRSYGGFMVLSAITQYPDLWAAAVEFVGIADFVTFLQNTGDWRRAHRESEYGSLTEDRDLLEAISPIHDVDQIECPLFVQHGANDPRVPVGETEQIAAALRERDVPVETLVFEDEGHHTTDRENRIEEFDRVAAFLDRHV